MAELVPGRLILGAWRDSVALGWISSARFTGPNPSRRSGRPKPRPLAAGRLTEPMSGHCPAGTGARSTGWDVGPVDRWFKEEKASMKKVEMVRGIYTFVRSPTGQRIVDEVLRQAGDPQGRRYVVDLVRRLRTGHPQPIVVDADPPDR